MLLNKYTRIEQVSEFSLVRVNSTVEHKKIILIPRMFTDRCPVRKSQDKSAVLVRKKKQAIKAPQERKSTVRVTNVKNEKESQDDSK